MPYGSSMHKQEAHRRALAAVDNARVDRTTKRLVDAYVELAASEEGVSVSSLCAHAGVGRSTFYTHFATLDQLASAAIRDAIAGGRNDDVKRRAEHRLRSAQITTMGARELVERTQKVGDLIRQSIARGSREAVQADLIEVFADSFIATVVVANPGLPDVDAEFQAHFIAGGTVQVLLDWIVEPQVGVEHLVEQITSLMPTWMTADRSTRQS